LGKSKDYGISTSNKFKIIGLVLCISIFSISIIAFSLENFKYNVLDRIAKTVLVLGLLIISISKEKIEDELIAKIECNPIIML
jgi:hypothetical protein